MTEQTSASPDLLPEVRAQLDRLAEFLTLEPDWDSYGAIPIPPLVVAEAKRLIETVARLHQPALGAEAAPYNVAPLCYGGVQIEWVGPLDEVEIEVEIEPDGAGDVVLSAYWPLRPWRSTDGLDWPNLLAEIAAALDGEDEPEEASSG